MSESEYGITLMIQRVMAMAVETVILPKQLKSVTPSRIAENAQVFDFTIAEEDIRVV